MYVCTYIYFQDRKNSTRIFVTLDFWLTNFQNINEFARQLNFYDLELKSNYKLTKLTNNKLSSDQNLFLDNTDHTNL